jgi:tRNA pseudouridine55 synthase
MLSGFLVVDKPAGPTSHDCVTHVRRALGIRRVGHAGTLDPLATGVLVIGVGKATRLLEYVQGQPKTYRARARFGMATDTQDSTGAILSTADASSLRREEVEAVLPAFTGELLQVPPMHSALKLSGRKLYELAREGRTVERAARPVTIYELRLLEFLPGAEPEAEFWVRCSSGTYIRTLCDNLGEQLGPGATMIGLVREGVGHFDRRQAVPLDAVEASTALLPPVSGVAHLPAVRLAAEAAERLTQGQAVLLDDAPPAGVVRVHGPDHGLLAVGRVEWTEDGVRLVPEKVLAPANKGDGATDAAHPGA